MHRFVCFAKDKHPRQWVPYRIRRKFDLTMFKHATSTDFIISFLFYFVVCIFLRPKRLSKSSSEYSRWFEIINRNCPDFLNRGHDKDNKIDEETTVDEFVKKKNSSLQENKASTRRK